MKDKKKIHKIRRYLNNVLKNNVKKKKQSCVVRFGRADLCI